MDVVGEEVVDEDRRVEVESVVGYELSCVTDAFQTLSFFTQHLQEQIGVQ